MALYDAYDKKSDQQGLGWADQWDYKYNDKYGSEDSQDNKSGNNKEKLAKVKSAASAGMGKTKTVVSSGAQKVASGTSSGFKWIKEKVQKKPQ
ncbi:hypothetical protein M758_8G144000 [Ceratodon purpureus]|uniref:Uncharacterized protein n=1 Tax=Ceratodon purpureus TaxID=3225 RepID=A0A8T0GZ15_CERPU|nr:hypothetical protein KC19_8G147800 [Ceratodon purpureus]KAG0608928.1 hypothetical protein M758_8G144000 [Ceratodon purpureus]